MDKYRLKITGKEAKYFLKHLIIKKIKLYNIITRDNEIIITVNSDDYLKILDMKTSCKISIINRFGFVKIKYLLNKYKYMIIFFVITLLILILSSNFVFSIDVIHSKEEIRTLIKNDLNLYGIKMYHFKVPYDKKEEIRNKILEKEKDKIEWLEIDSIGTKYIVNVEERIINKTKENNDICDLVAKKDSMILNIEAKEGEIVKKKYDYVRKGETIVSGTIKNKDTEVKKVRADGKVYGEVWYKVEVELPKEYHEEIRTGKKTSGIAFRVANKKLEIPRNKKIKSYQSEDSILFENRLVPISLVIEKKYEIKIIDKKYNINNAEKEGIILASNRLLKRLGEESVILDKKVLKKVERNSKIVIDVFFKVKEDITDYKKISNELKKEDDSNERTN